MLQEYTLEIRVRYPECDPEGIVHHSRYFVYFEMARTELYRANGGSYAQMEAAGKFFVVASADCKYLRPAKYDELIQVTVRIQKVTRVKIVHEYEIHRGKTLLAVAHVTLAMVDREGKVVLIPDEFRPDM
ncbi:MAG: thioesterase family protein [Planctomycetia bacterium]|nr:thioesterase family protein [Planctomycetia bacterium]